MNRTARAAYCWRTTDPPGIGVAVLARRGSHEGVVGVEHDGWPAEANAVSDVREHMPSGGVTLHDAQTMPRRWREIYDLANSLVSKRVGEARRQSARASSRETDAREGSAQGGQIRYMNPRSFPGGVDRLHGLFRRAADIARTAWGWNPGDVDIHPMSANAHASAQAAVDTVGGGGPKKIRLNRNALRHDSDDHIVDLILHELCHHRRGEIRPLSRDAHDRIFCELLSVASASAGHGEAECHRFLPTRPNPRPPAQRPGARRLPMPFPTYDLAVGDSLWWGAPDPRDWGEPVQWFTDNPSTARAYMEGRYGAEGDWATMFFDVRRAAKLVHMRNWEELGRLATILGFDPEESDPRDIAPALCDAGYDGWWIDEGDHDGADAMLCNPRTHVTAIRLVDQGDGWTGEDPRPNPSRRQRPSSLSPYADPGLWQRAKEEALRRAGGRHSARAMQAAGALYRAAGGRYRGSPTAAQRSLAKWTREDWTTATGERACRQTARGTRCDRYLPRAAWQNLTTAQALATRRAKLRATSQYVPNTPAARAAGRRARTAPRPNPERSLRARLAELRPQMAAAAQAVYDDWNQDGDGVDEELGEGGICDRVAEALWGVIDNGIPNVEIREGGWEGDDHAYIIVQRGRKAFVVDIPPEVYETGGGYSWRKRKGVQFEPDDVVIEEADAVEE